MKKKPARSPWPKGARCAVMISYDFDAESGWLSRGPQFERLPGVLSQGAYGAKVGIPRILDLLKAERVPATFYIPGWVVERHPERCLAIRDAGHEIGHHGYLHERAEPDNPDGERAAFADGMRALGKVLDVQPAGYRAPGWDLTPITLELVQQHGMFYSSNLMDDAFPYLHPLSDAPEVAEPADREPRPGLRDLARRVPRDLRAGRRVRPHHASADQRDAVAPALDAEAAALHQAPPRRLVGHRARDRRPLDRAGDGAAAAVTAEREAEREA
jgi:hypothetical protein